MLLARDLIDPSTDVAEQLAAHVGFQHVNEVAFAFPLSFEDEDYVQILTGIATDYRLALGGGYHPKNKYDLLRF